MQYDHHMKKLAILYFEGKATDEEELKEKMRRKREEQDRTEG